MFLDQSGLTSPLIIELYQRVLKKVSVLQSYAGLFIDIPALISINKLVGHNFLDCGAWTENASNGRFSINTHDYLDYCVNHNHLYANFAAYDGNFDPAGISDNHFWLDKMAERGLKPMPVVHDYEKYEIPLLVDKGYTSFALGSIKPYGKKCSIRRKEHVLKAIDEIHKRVKKPRIHLFGSGSFSELFDAQIYSADSSNWVQNSMTGCIYVWNEFNYNKLDKTDIIYFEDYLGERKPNRMYFDKYPYRNALEQFLWDTLKITLCDLTGHRRHFFRMLINSFYYMQLEEILTEHHRKQGFQTYD